MKKETIQSRINQFSEEREKLRQQLTLGQQQLHQIGANIGAYNGAIQALESLLTDFDKESEDELSLLDLKEMIGADSLEVTA